MYEYIANSQKNISLNKLTNASLPEKKFFLTREKIIPSNSRIYAPFKVFYNMIKYEKKVCKEKTCIFPSLFSKKTLIFAP